MRKNERGATADAVGGGRGELLYDMACPDWLEPEPSYGRETSEEPEDLRSVNEARLCGLPGVRWNTRRFWRPFLTPSDVECRARI